MDLLIEATIFGLILSADSFSAAVAMGFRPHKLVDSFKFALSSGSAEALVALVGAWAGHKIVSQFDSIDHWVSFTLLMAVAIHMAYEGWVELKEKRVEVEEQNFHSYFKVLIVSFATSLDALAVGVGLGSSQKPLMPFIVSIGIWAFIATIVGMSMAKRVSKKLGPIFSLIGSLTLMGIAVHMLSLHIDL